MAEFVSTKLKSKPSAEVIVRSATKQDAAAILNLSKDVIGEEVFLTSSITAKRAVDRLNSGQKILATTAESIE